jgi:hypothetical protein
MKDQVDETIRESLEEGSFLFLEEASDDSTGARSSDEDSSSSDEDSSSDEKPAAEPEFTLDNDQIESNFYLELSLSRGSSSFLTREQITENCFDFIDPENLPIECQHEKHVFDKEAAKKALLKDQVINNVHKFSSGEYYGDSCIWSIKFNCDSECDRDSAFDVLESLLVDGSSFCYPELYDSFGVNEFDEQFDAKEFSNMKALLWQILCITKSLKHSFWEGHYEYWDYDILNTEREDYFLFETHGGKTFVLKFRHAFFPQ